MRTNAGIYIDETPAESKLKEIFTLNYSADSKIKGCKGMGFGQNTVEEKHNMHAAFVCVLCV